MSEDASIAQKRTWTLYTDRQRYTFLAVLFAVSTSNYIDRNMLAVLLEPIKQEFHVSDSMLGLLSGFCFALFYALFGMPVARWADRGNRRTIITVALVAWSLMTVACGFAQSFWQLAAARVGVGAGESGAIPPAHALIADYFPQAQRARAIAIFTAASTAGYLLGFGFGGYIAAIHGWRAAFLSAGVLGLLMTSLTRFGLAEPRLRLGFPGSGNGRESIRQSLAALGAKQSFLYGLAGCVLYFFTAYGSLIFISSFLIRLLHVPLARVSLIYGGTVALASVIGTLSGGWLADRLGSRDVRWLAWLPAITCALAGPFFMAALCLDAFAPFLVLIFIGWMLIAGGLPPVFAAIHSVCGGRRRATAIAIVLFSSTLLGGGFGPLTTGALSDALSAAYGVNGLRYTLIVMMSLLLVTGALFGLFGRAMPPDVDG